MKKRKTQLQKLLDILSDGEWHWTDELAREVGHRFSDSIQKARNKGHNIPPCVREGSQNRYRLIQD